MEKLLIPGMINPQNAYRELLQSHISSKIRWLDLGCGHRFFSNSLPNSRSSQYELADRAEIIVGLDGDFSDLKKNTIIQHKILGDIRELPFEDDSFNLVTANMVVEHLSEPELLLSEIKRILTDGGLMIFHTPNRLSYKILLAKAIPEPLKKPIIKFLQNRGGGCISHVLSHKFTWLSEKVCLQSGIYFKECILLSGASGFGNAGAYCCD
jgi:ubiquinone/menaquinone biosynthesis C-methylase UbiE